MNGYFKLPAVKNEPLLDYSPGSPARESLKAELQRQSAITLDIPVIIGAKISVPGRRKRSSCLTTTNMYSHAFTRQAKEN